VISKPGVGELAKAEVQIATRADCFDVGRRLRSDDWLEMRYLMGECDPSWSLDLQRMSAPQETFCLRFDGRRAAIFGCPEGQPGVGVPWMMGTDDLLRRRFTFHHMSKRAVSYWAAQYSVLANVVWEGSSSIPWLRRLGFSVGEDVVRETPSGGKFLGFNLKGGKVCVSSQDSHRQEQL